MRIRFAARHSEPESDARRLLSERIDAFWRETASSFAPNRRKELSGPAAVRDLERRLCDRAEQIAPELRLEIDVAPDQECRIVVHADGTGLDPLHTEVVDRAPRWPGITVVKHRPELTVDAALDDVQARAGLNLGSARVRMGFSRGHLLEVVVYAPTFASATDDRALDAANLLVPRLLGEELFDDWVGSVDVAPLSRGGALRVLSDGAPSLDSTLPLAEVLPAAEAAIRGLYAELPETPYHVFCERAEWTLLELEPSMAEDYSAQDDAVLVSTMLPEAIKCFLQGSPFSSRRFSKHGERFVYVKIDTLGKSVEERHALRVELEDALNFALVPGRIGCVVGAGIGARYLYLNLALENLEHGMRVACERLRKLDVPRRAWLLFCDSGLRSEWVGVWDDGPEPP